MEEIWGPCIVGIASSVIDKNIGREKKMRRGMPHTISPNGPFVPEKNYTVAEHVQGDLGVHPIRASLRALHSLIIDGGCRWLTR